MTTKSKIVLFIVMMLIAVPVLLVWWMGYSDRRLCEELSQLNLDMSVSDVNNLITEPHYLSDIHSDYVQITVMPKGPLSEWPTIRFDKETGTVVWVSCEDCGIKLRSDSTHIHPSLIDSL